MNNSIANRLYVVVGLVVVVYVISRGLQIAIGPPEVEMPEWSLRDLPYQLGNWQGTETEMDAKIADATGAQFIVNRAYQSESGQTAFLHTAMFSDPAVGVYHSPMNCYPSSGWNKLYEDHENLKVSDELTIPLTLVGWEKGGERVLVVYWYQLGDYVLYDRFDLGSKLRWELRGHSKWPALVKTMVFIPVPDRDEDRAAFLKFIEDVAKWLNGPEHQKYFAKWRQS